MRFGYKGLKAPVQPSHYPSSLGGFLTIEATVEILFKGDDKNFGKLLLTEIKWF